MQDQHGGHPLDSLRPVVSLAEVVGCSRRSTTSTSTRSCSAGSSPWSARPARSSSSRSALPCAAAWRSSARARLPRARRDHAEPEDVEQLFGAGHPAPPAARSRVPRRYRHRRRRDRTSRVAALPRACPAPGARVGRRPCLDGVLARGVSRRLSFPLIARRRLAGSPSGTQRARDADAEARPRIRVRISRATRSRRSSGPPRRASRQRTGSTASSCASSSRRRRRSLRSYSTSARRWASTRRRRRGSTSGESPRPPCARSWRAPMTRAGAVVFDASPTASRLLEPVRGRTQIVLSRVERATSLHPRARSTTRWAACCGADAHCRPAASSSSCPTSSANSAPLAGGVGRLTSDVVPVVIQDPTWERSSPTSPALIRLDVETGALRPVRLTRRETHARRALHEQRYDELIRLFRKAGMDPITLDDAAPERIHRAFLAWAARRARALRSAR